MRNAGRGKGKKMGARLRAHGRDRRREETEGKKVRRWEGKCGLRRGKLGG